MAAYKNCTRFDRYLELAVIDARGVHS
jgi:hypothetical protein